MRGDPDYAVELRSDRESDRSLFIESSFEKTCEMVHSSGCSVLRSAESVSGKARRIERAGPDPVAYCVVTMKGKGSRVCMQLVAGPIWCRREAATPDRVAEEFGGVSGFRARPIATTAVSYYLSPCYVIL